MRDKILAMLGVALAVTVQAENSVVLESFEANANSAAVMTGNAGRLALSPPGVNLSQYTKAGAEDVNVTDGSKSLKVVLSGKKMYSTDFQIKLSKEASASVRNAAASGDTARYILRYDVIFPPMSDFVYFNNALYFGDNRDVLLSVGGKRTMSVALDLLTGLPADGPLTMVFADDFDVKSTFTNVVVYIDNIRLVDTYAAGAKPKTYVLQSFEDSNNPTGGVSNFTEWDADKPVTRTAFTQYTAASPTDVRVTEGKHALEVKNSSPESWHADFTIPFNKTKLAEILKLDQPTFERPSGEKLARYTLRFDVTYPDMTNEWMNSTFHTMEGFLPIIQVRQNKVKDQRQTYSITLDQAEWGTWMDQNPVLMFITEGPQKTKNTKVYYDNFRLIDTGEESKTPAQVAAKAAQQKSE